jgi:hypothetical protein
MFYLIPADIPPKVYLSSPSCKVKDEYWHCTEQHFSLAGRKLLLKDVTSTLFVWSSTIIFAHHLLIQANSEKHFLNMATFNLPADFAIQSVDYPAPVTATTHQLKHVAKPSDSIILPAKNPPVPPPKSDPFSTQTDLGVLTSFMGTYEGTGFNTIFRPNSKYPLEKLTNPVIKVKSNDDDNLLQMNLTTEQLTFSKSLGNIPNRGLDNQPDINLHGVGYLQTIQDVTNQDTGRADGCPRDIHFEPGLWVLIPETVTPPRKASLAQMASIPHGTTVNAQSTCQPELLKAYFVIPPYLQDHPLGTAPVVIGDTKPTEEFDQLNFENTRTRRIPQDLSLFLQEETITFDIFTDPHKVLNDINRQKKILRAVKFTVSTDSTVPPDPTNPNKLQLGGGTDNIDFLVGSGPKPDTSPNARAASMSSTFWISTVQLDIEVPAMKVADGPKYLPHHDSNSRVPVPCFQILPPHDLTAPKTITVEYVQIQYSQTVILNFAGDSWPHVSVATLVPQGALPVPASAWDNSV